MQSEDDHKPKPPRAAVPMAGTPSDFDGLAGMMREFRRDNPEQARVEVKATLSMFAARDGLPGRGVS